MTRLGMTIAVVVLAGLCMAPTVGDVGGCGSDATFLDIAAFGRGRKHEDCEHCTECGLSSSRCERACDAAKAPDVELPPTCRPLLHDGEVCLRALHAASCEAWATYVDDTAGATPSECEFCRVGVAPPPSLADDPRKSPTGDGGSP